MDKEMIGRISGLLVIVSVIPYLVRTYQGKIRPNLSSWSLWTIMGLAILLTFRSSGAKENIWAAVFGFTNPLLVTIMALLRQYERTRLNRFDKICLILGLLAFAMWLVMKGNKELSQYALYVALIADSFAIVPTIVVLWKSPEVDRPFAWGFFSLAYSLNFFAISEYTPANLILPIYMVTGSLFVTVPLCIYRFKKKSPIMDWI